MKKVDTHYACDHKNCANKETETGTYAGSSPNGWLTVYYTDVDGEGNPGYKGAHFCCFEHAALWCHARRGQDYQPIVIG